MRRISWILISVYCIGVTVSQSATHAPGYDRCIDTSGGVTSRLIQCNRMELEYQDKRLNRYYQMALQAVAELDEHNRINLRNAQRAWIKYRDANCELYYHLTGGTMDMLNGDGCMIDMTTRRAEELKDIAEMFQ